MEVLIKGQEYVIFAFCILIVAGLIKKNEYFIHIFNLLSKIKSKRLFLSLLSITTGTLPVPGRVLISASILDSIKTKSKETRKKFAIVDYISTHHYYLWSPIEKSVIIPMSILGITYYQFISYSVYLLIPTFIYILFYSFVFIKENDLDFVIEQRSFNLQKFLFELMPFLLGLIAMVLTSTLVLSSVILASYYLLYTRDLKIFKDLNYKLLSGIVLIILLGNIVTQHLGTLSNYIQNSESLVIASFVGFLISFSLGSSGKFAGIVALLTTIYGIEYFLLFLCIEFSGYLLSPLHKCLFIGKAYFGISITEYYRHILFWVVSMIIFTVIHYVGLI